MGQQLKLFPDYEADQERKHLQQVLFLSEERDTKLKELVEKFNEDFQKIMNGEA